MYVLVIASRLAYYLRYVAAILIKVVAAFKKVVITIKSSYKIVAFIAIVIKYREQNGLKLVYCTLERYKG